MDFDIKERIIKGAEAIFAREGTSRVTMEDLAEYLKISKKTIYNHFSSKSALVYRVVSNLMKDIVQSLEEIAGDPALDFTSRLKAILEYSFTQVSRNGAIIMDNYSGMDLQETDSPFETMRRKILELSSRLFQEGIEKGMIRDDLAKDFVPYFYLNVIEGCVNIYREADISIRKEELFREALRITFEGILSDNGRSHFRKGSLFSEETEAPGFRDLSLR
ncbi:MAG: TetR/AcrR family transcriptional regulator [Spirochaetales bacterium]|nr:TetR/AcrR family transcriptional regulator [Spirochaetales bacterium]